MPHFVRVRVLGCPGRHPRSGNYAAYAIATEERRTAPRIIHPKVELKIYSEEFRKVDVRVCDTGALAEHFLPIRFRRIPAWEVIGLFPRQIVPAGDDSSGDVDPVVRKFLPVVVQARFVVSGEEALVITRCPR